MKKVNAVISIQVLCTCPECDAFIDIFDLGEIRDVVEYRPLSENNDIEITCPECGKQFIVSDISYY